MTTKHCARNSSPAVRLISNLPCGLPKLQNENVPLSECYTTTAYAQIPTSSEAFQNKNNFPGIFNPKFSKPERCRYISVASHVLRRCSTISPRARNRRIKTSDMKQASSRHQADIKQTNRFGSSYRQVSYAFYMRQISPQQN